MATSNVAICNYALSMIGAKQITLLDNTTNEGRQCLARFDMIRDSLLELFPWTFSIDKKTLVQSSTSPVFGREYSYVLPVDCIRVLDTSEDVNYEIVGDRIQTDSESLSIRYIAKITNPTLFSPLFDIAFGARLATELAMNLTGDKERFAYAEKEYSRALLEAVDANADYDDRVDESVGYADVRS